MNKKLILQAIFCISILPALAQDTTYYDAGWRITVASKASYFRLKWKEGKGWKVKDCYLSGKTQMDGAYSDDSCKTKQGAFSFYNKEGQLNHACNYMNGELEGLDMEYYDNGQLRTKGNYKEGEEVGEWLGYYSSGKPSAVARFKNGEQVSGKFFNEDGSKNKEVTEFFRDCLFPGGLPGLQRFLIRNLHYPDSAVSHSIEGTVYIGFNVTKDGKIEDIKVTQSVEPSLDNEALRVIGLMPDWEPSIIGGILCDSHQVQPINFVLQESESAYNQLTQYDKAGLFINRN